MLVSVLIATRERPEALRRCLASVACQTYADLELLVWDAILRGISRTS